jgi:hypothetical protein
LNDPAEIERTRRDLWDAVNWDFGGFSSPDQVQRIRTMASRIAGDAGTAYAHEKAGKLMNWVEIAYSTRKHAKLGIERVRQFARGEAYALMHLADDLPKGP